MRPKRTPLKLLSIMLLISLGGHLLLLLGWQAESQPLTLDGQRQAVQVSYSVVAKKAPEPIQEQEEFPQPKPTQAKPTPVDNPKPNVALDKPPKPSPKPVLVPKKALVNDRKNVAVITPEVAQVPVKKAVNPVQPPQEDTLQKSSSVAETLQKPELINRAEETPPAEQQAPSEINAADKEVGKKTASASEAQQTSVVAARPKQQTPVPYPRLAQRRGQEGTVWLRVQVGIQGRVTDIEVSISTGFPRLDQAALAAVRSWAFQPALRDGQPEVSYVKIPVRFQLDNSR